jgi:hypothetical protein
MSALVNVGVAHVAPVTVAVFVTTAPVAVLENLTLTVAPLKQLPVAVAVAPTTSLTLMMSSLATLAMVGATNVTFTVADVAALAEDVKPPND